MSPATATLALLVSAAVEVVSAVTFAVPSQALTGGLKYAPLDPAPVGISYVFVGISFDQCGGGTVAVVIIVVGGN